MHRTTDCILPINRNFFHKLSRLLKSAKILPHENCPIYGSRYLVHPVYVSCQSKQQWGQDYSRVEALGPQPHQLQELLESSVLYNQVCVVFEDVHIWPAVELTRNLHGRHYVYVQSWYSDMQPQHTALLVASAACMFQSCRLLSNFQHTNIHTCTHIPIVSCSDIRHTLSVRSTFAPCCNNISTTSTCPILDVNFVLQPLQ